MEQCFRIAFWMFILTGCLQAIPVPPNQCKDPNGKPLFIEKSEIAFKYLREEPECANETFISPKNQTNLHATLECFIEGLKNATMKCKNVDRIVQAVEYLDAKTNPSGSALCENEGSREQYAVFVKATETFVSMVNTQCGGTDPTVSLT